MILTAVLTKYYKSVETLKCVKGLSGNGQPLFDAHQHCANARFIYAGSQRHMMGEIFTSPARPFYQSTAIMELHPIDIGTYTKFIRKHFLIANKDITEETVQNVYERFEGITWYIQFISNSLYAMTATGEICTADKVSIAIENI